MTRDTLSRSFFQKNRFLSPTNLSQFRNIGPNTVCDAEQGCTSDISAEAHVKIR